MDRVAWDGPGRRQGRATRRDDSSDHRERADPALAARLEAIAWATAIAADPRVVYLDTETTGLGPTAEVIDVAVVGADGRVYLDTLVRPVARIPSDASAIHGIFDADVAAAPTWPEVHDRLCALLAGRIAVVYNAAFDRRLVSQCCDRHRVSVPDAAWECAMRRFAAFHGESSARGGYRLQRLDRAVATFGGPPPGHRAAADALACRAVVLGMAAVSRDAPSDAGTPESHRARRYPNPLHRRIS